MSLPPGRYGPPDTAARRRRTTWVLAAAGLVGVAFVVWLGLANAHPAVTFRDVGFTVRDASSVRVVFDVIRADPSRPAVCRVTALNTHYGEVGVVEVQVPPSDRGALRQQVDVATAEEATTGVVDSCWVLDD